MRQAECALLRGGCGRRPRTAGVGTAAAVWHGTRNTVPSRAATAGSLAPGLSYSSRVRRRARRAPKEGRGGQQRPGSQSHRGGPSPLTEDRQKPGLRSDWGRNDKVCSKCLDCLESPATKRCVPSARRVGARCDGVEAMSCSITRADRGESSYQFTLARSSSRRPSYRSSIKRESTPTSSEV
jgi:hypothetical protein